MTEPVFEPDGDLFVPTGHAIGPWDRRAQHGGAPAALLARAVEAVPPDADDELVVSRVTYELLRPVPIVPLSVETAVLRPGRKVQVVQASLRAGETEVVRATALRIRRLDIELPEGVGDAGPGDGAPAAGPEEGRELRFPFEQEDGPAFHRTGMEIRFVGGGFDRPGRSTAWFRLRRPVVGDEQPSPVMRAVATADFGNGISWVLPAERFVFINPDLTVHLARPPTGEWLAMRSTTRLGATGAGLAESALSDPGGRFGRSVQSLLVDHR